MAGSHSAGERTGGAARAAARGRQSSMAMARQRNAARIATLCARIRVQCQQNFFGTTTVAACNSGRKIACAKSHRVATARRSDSIPRRGNFLRADQYVPESHKSADHFAGLSPRHIYLAGLAERLLIPDHKVQRVRVGMAQFPLPCHADVIPHWLCFSVHAGDKRASNAALTERRSDGVVRPASS